MASVDHSYYDAPPRVSEPVGAGGSQYDGNLVGDEQIAVGGRVDGGEGWERGLKQFRGPRDRHALG